MVQGRGPNKNTKNKAAAVNRATAAVRDNLGRIMYSKIAYVLHTLRKANSRLQKHVTTPQSTISIGNRKYIVEAYLPPDIEDGVYRMNVGMYDPVTHGSCATWIPVHFRSSKVYDLEFTNGDYHLIEADEFPYEALFKHGLRRALQLYRNNPVPVGTPPSAPRNAGNMRLTNLPPNVHRHILKMLPLRNVRRVGAAAPALRTPANNVSRAMVRNRTAALKKARAAVLRKTLPLSITTLMPIIDVKIRYALSRIERLRLRTTTEIKSSETKIQGLRGPVKVYVGLYPPSDDENDDADPNIYSLYVEMVNLKNPRELAVAIIDVHFTTPFFVLELAEIDIGAWPSSAEIQIFENAVDGALAGYTRNPIRTRPRANAGPPRRQPSRQSALIPGKNAPFNVLSRRTSSSMQHRVNRSRAHAAVW